MILASISNFLNPWVLPPGLNCLLMMIGFALYFFSRKIGLLFIALGFVSLWLLSAPIVVYSMLNAFQDQYPILKPGDLVNPKQNYAILVLGGGDTVKAEYDFKQTVSDATRERLDYGAYLQKSTRLPLIVSGGKNPLGTISQAALMSNYLQESFHTKPDFLEEQSTTTADESKHVAEILKKQGIAGVYLVTHAWHMPRSIYIFNCMGIKTIPAPMGHYVYGPGFALISYLPNMEAFYAGAVAMHEWIGMMWYKARYDSECGR